MHVDRLLGDRLLMDTEGLLRAALTGGSATSTLARERAHAQRYVQFVVARFDDGGRELESQKERRASGAAAVQSAERGPTSSANERSSSRLQ